MGASALKIPAGGLVVAPRLPDPPTRRGATPFASAGDVVLDCDVPGCGWHWMGPRPLAGLASKTHHKEFHSESTSVVLLNHARQ